jgi:hypothetical protein
VAESYKNSVVGLYRRGVAFFTRADDTTTEEEMGHYPFPPLVYTLALIRGVVMGCEGEPLDVLSEESTTFELSRVEFICGKWRAFYDERTAKMRRGRRQ